MKISITLHPKLLAITYKSIPKNSTHIDMEFIFQRSVKDQIQSLGIPHTEIGKILVNSQQVDLHYIGKDKDKIEVFTVSDIPSPEEAPRFVCDVHLRKLSRRLRFLGFDTLFDSALDDPELAKISFDENRVMLTHDRGLLMRNTIKLGIFIQNPNPDLQVKEVLHRLNISKFISPFSRCIACNGKLKPASIPSEFFNIKLAPQIPPRVREWCKEYHYCTSCEKIYWKGSHYLKLEILLNFLQSNL